LGHDSLLGTAAALNVSCGRLPDRKLRISVAKVFGHKISLLRGQCNSTTLLPAEKLLSAYRSCCEMIIYGLSTTSQINPTHTRVSSIYGTRASLQQGVGVSSTSLKNQNDRVQIEPVFLRDRNRRSSTKGEGARSIVTLDLIHCRTASDMDQPDRLISVLIRSNRLRQPRERVRALWHSCVWSAPRRPGSQS
jgi:hypothetical protein